MLGKLRQFGSAFLWVGHLGGSVSGYVFLWSLAGAFLVSPLTFLLQAPLLFQIPFSVGLFLLSFAALSSILGAVSTRRRSVSSDDVSDHVGPAAQQAQVPPSDASLALYPPVRQDELTGAFFEMRTVYIAEFARRASSIKYTTPTLEQLTFVECRIVGPAVMVDLNTGRMEGDLFPDCKWDEGLDAYWAPDFSRNQKYAGVIALEDCLFRGCRFSQVGFLYRPSDDEDDTEEAEVVELEEGKDDSNTP